VSLTPSLTQKALLFAVTSTGKNQTDKTGEMAAKLESGTAGGVNLDTESRRIISATMIRGRSIRNGSL
jgi:hypothetical protein